MPAIIMYICSMVSNVLYCKNRMSFGVGVTSKWWLVSHLVSIINRS